MAKNFCIYLDYLNSCNHFRFDKMYRDILKISAPWEFWPPDLAEIPQLILCKNKTKDKNKRQNIEGKKHQLLKVAQNVLNTF